MKILVLSDLHMDTSDNFGTFQWSDAEFIMQIESVRNYYAIDKVIFNGDTFELFKYRFEDISKAHPALMTYFGDKDFIFIKGNHDIVSKFGIDHYQITNSQGQSIYLEHGHNADWFDGSRFGHAISKFGFSLLKKLTNSKKLMDIYFKIVTLNDQIYHIPKKYNSIKYLTYALKLLKEHDMVILSHTHKLESHHTYYLYKKKRYLNSGTCSLGRFQGIVIDSETLKYELIKEAKVSSKESYQLRYAI